MPSSTFVAFDSERAVLRATGQLTLEVVRRDWTASISSASPVSADELVHPWLAFVGAVVARWTGRSALHAAAVVIDGRAWLLLAPPEGGKSTTAVALAQRGHVVLSDDLAVVEGSTVFAGPRSADLRQAAAGQLSSGRPTVRRSSEKRWRHDLGSAPYEVELGGFLSLEWGENVSMRRVPPVERLQLLGTHEAMAAGPTTPTSFLDLAARPFYALTRPRQWKDLDGALDLLEATTAKEWSN